MGRSTAGAAVGVAEEEIVFLNNRSPYLDSSPRKAELCSVARSDTIATEKGGSYVIKEKCNYYWIRSFSS